MRTKPIVFCTVCCLFVRTTVLETDISNGSSIGAVDCKAEQFALEVRGGYPLETGNGRLNPLYRSTTPLEIQAKLAHFSQ